MMKDIIGYEGLYAITDCGECYSYRSNKFLKAGITKGRRRFALYDRFGNVKNHLAARLVAKAFIPNPNCLETVDHINSNPSDDRVDNLQWMTLEDNNNKYHDQFKKQIMCVETGIVFSGIRECEREMKLNHGNLLMHLKGHPKHKTVKGYHFVLL